MKLFRQTQRLFLRTALPVFLVFGILAYLAVQAIFDFVVDEKLSEVQTEIENYVHLHDTLPIFFQSVDEHFVAEKQLSGGTLPENFGDTMLYNELQKEQEPFRRLRFPVRIHGQPFQVSIFQSTIEHEDIGAAVTGLLALLFGLLFGIMVWVNQRVAGQVWNPFFRTLEKMRKFRLTDAEPLRLAKTSVTEFQELNATLESLADAVRKDFRTIKQFTENASHELQTPLAVIQNKVEIMLQHEGLTEIQTRHLDIIGQSTRRMARLNQSLLLLAKIENKQYLEQNTVDLKKMIEKRLVWLEDFITEKGITLHTEIEDIALETNPFLTETLVTNLLTNAVKHSSEGGTIHVRLNSKKLLIENSAEPPGMTVEALTARFMRGNTRSEGVGLGLSMVREICEQSNFGLQMIFEKGFWTTTVVFPHPDK